MQLIKIAHILCTSASVIFYSLYCAIWFQIVFKAYQRKRGTLLKFTCGCICVHAYNSATVFGSKKKFDGIYLIGFSRSKGFQSICMTILSLTFLYNSQRKALAVRKPTILIDTGNLMLSLLTSQRLT